MNFKKTLVALAMAGFASSAMASDVTLDNGVWTLSAEGVQAEVSEPLDSAVLNVYLDQGISASGTVSFSFDSGFEFDSVNLASGSGSVTASVAHSGANIGTLTAGPLAGMVINYGSASFTFVSYEWDLDTKTIELTLGNGQPLLGGASFGLTTFPTDFDMIDVATISVVTNEFNGDEKDNFSKVVSQTATQYVITTDIPMEGTVAVAKRYEFVSGAIGSSVDNLNNEYGSLHIIDHSEYKASATATRLDVQLLGDFTQTDGNTKWAAGAFDLSTATSSVLTADKVKITKDIASGYMVGSYDSATGNGTIWNLSFTTAGTGLDDNLVTPFKVSADIKVENIADPINYLSDEGFGSWDLEDGVINVPYLPVGFAGLSANVEISNESTKDATIYVEAFNQEGEYFAQVELPKLAEGQTVTKVSAQDLINAFGLTGQNKLSVTFSFDVEGEQGAEGITLAPYYRQNESRINVLSDEYKGK